MTTEATADTVGTDPSRELALVLSVDFHKRADTDDPRAVVDTAQDFLTFLTGSSTVAGYQPKHAVGV